MCVIIKVRGARYFVYLTVKVRKTFIKARLPIVSIKDEGRKNEVLVFFLYLIITVRSTG